MRYQLEASEVKPGDTIPGVGKVIDVRPHPLGITLVMTWSGAETYDLCADHPVWVERDGWPS